MADPLVTQEQLEARLGETFTGTAATQVEALLDDASALVRQIAEDDFLDDEGAVDTPEAVVPVVVEMVRRALDNPHGYSSEEIPGGYSYSRNGKTNPGIYATVDEKRIIRTAAGKLSVAALDLEGYLPNVPESEQFLADDSGGDSILWFHEDDMEST